MSIGASQGSARKQLFGSRSSRLPAHAVYLCLLVLLRFNSRCAFPIHDRLLLGMSDCKLIGSDRRYSSGCMFTG